MSFTSNLHEGLRPKVALIVLCRMNSSRLPGKILKKINGQSILEYIYERLRCVASDDEIVVATSRDEQDWPIVVYCEDRGWQYFRGDLNSVAERFLACAVHYNFDYGVRITGDSLFADPQTIGQVAALARSGLYDFISNKKGRTFPVGMSVEALRIAFFQEVLLKFEREDHFEHVTAYLYEHEDVGSRFYLYNDVCPEAGGVQLAIDTYEDYERAKRLLSKVERPHTEYNMCDWIALLQEEGALPKASMGAST